MERNALLDYLKLILSFSVIAIHLEGFLSEVPTLGWLISNGIARIAVPCFFIINGYYISSVIENKNNLKKYCIRYCIIYIVWMMIYAPFHQNIIGAIHFPTAIRQTITWLLGWGHLWYVSAMIGGVLFLYILKAFIKKTNILLILALLLFLIGYIIQRLYLFDINIPTSTLCRNFLFIGFPFIFIGYYIRKKHFIDKALVNKRTVFYILILFAILLVESFFTYKMQRNSDFYIVLPILCPLLILFIMKTNTICKLQAHTFISNLSGCIYFIHLLVMYSVISIFNFAPTKQFILILFFSMLISTGIIKLNQKIRLFL